MQKSSPHAIVLATAMVAAVFATFSPSRLLADGWLAKRHAYTGSLEGLAQEAIIIFDDSKALGGSAMEDLILKITVQGAAEEFAWVIPFPSQPTIEKAEVGLFEELYDYVEYRLHPPTKKARTWKSGRRFGGLGGLGDVRVLSRQTVGSYDVAVVQEDTPGTLNEWLEAEGYQRIEHGADVIEFYRRRRYVFACLKVSQAKLTADAPVDLHPLRFTFKTGGRDGVYFPMKMTGLQKQPFDVNLYVFYRAWLNDKLNQYGYEHRGFRRKYRDWDSPKCRPNAGKNWSKPYVDPFLREAGGRIKKVAKLFQELHPGERYYLTNIQAFKLDPADVRDWPGDLWLFPYYLDKTFAPYDARPGGPASIAYSR